jgi:putative ABC transport system permease protein
MLRFHGAIESSLLVGYEPSVGGGPWDLADGREPAADNEIVLDRVLAERHGIAVGDTLEISSLALNIVGLSNGTASIGQAYMFARKSMVESLLLAPGASSFILVSPASGTNVTDLAVSLQEIPGVNVLRKSEVMDNDEAILGSIMDQVIMLMVGASFIVGALVVGMVLYTATLERRAEYGILKAIGARGATLYRVVIFQAFIAAGLGVLVGIAFAFSMGWLVTTFNPQYRVVIQPSAFAFTAGAGLVMALVGALMPARAVVRLAPAEVFRR